MSLDREIAKAIGDVPECLAAGYVDLSSGMLLGAKTVDSHPAEVLDLVAAATADLYQGPNVSTIEKIFKKTRGVEDPNLRYFQEFVIFSDNLVHFFIRGKKNPEQVACFVCRKSVNLGMGLVKARLAAKNVESAF